MRIGQFSDSFLPVVDGVGRVVVSYARVMAELGEDVTVFAPEADMGDTSSLPYRVETYRTFSMPGRMPYRVGIPTLDIAFERKLRAVDLDIIHVHSPFMMGHVGVQLARKRRVPVIGSFHSKYYDDFSQILKMDALAKGGVKVVVDFYEQCDEVWAVSEGTAETLKSYGYRGEVYAMPNGTDIRALDPTVLPELCARYSIAPDVPLLLYVGQINWKKNIRRILEAAAMLRADGVPFRLLLAGQGPHHDEIAETITALGIGDRAALIGHVNNTRDLDGLYALASLFVFPSLYDNAPMVIREAAAMGTPAVLVAGSNSAEGVTDGANGLLCEDTAASLAAAIRRGLDEPSLLARMGDAAKETIPISWNELVVQVLERYRTLAERIQHVR